MKSSMVPVKSPFKTIEEAQQHYRRIFNELEINVQFHNVTRTDGVIVSNKFDMSFVGTGRFAIIEIED